MTNEYEVRIGTSYGPVAAGAQARATQHHVTIGGSGGDDRLRTALAVLRREIEAHAAEIEEPDRVRRDLDAVERDITGDDPDPRGVRDTLRRIIARVGMAGTVLAAASDLNDVIEALLGT
jgi:Family of unknown function (DUF5955)